MATPEQQKDAKIERLKKQIGFIDDESEHGQCVHAGTMGPLDCVFCISWAKRNAELRSQLADATKEAETYKRLYDLRGHALRRGCPQCGYEQKEIGAKE